MLDENSRGEEAKMFEHIPKNIDEQAKNSSLALTSIQIIPLQISKYAIQDGDKLQYRYNMFFERPLKVWLVGVKIFTMAKTNEHC